MECKMSTKTEFVADSGRDGDILVHAPEISVWMTSFGCLRSVEEFLAEWKQKNITEKQYYKVVNSCLLNLAETADATHRFGVFLPATVEPHYRRHVRDRDDGFLKVEFSPFFWRWYNWWDDYISTLSTIERRRVYRLALERLPALDMYRPAGDWLHYRTNPVLVLSTN